MDCHLSGLYPHYWPYGGPLESLEVVLRRLDKASLRVKMKKCEIMKPEIDYLGHKIDKTGLHPLPDKVQAI